jgi:5-carboxymethyl-2-hydroxymuconate isomerase
MPHLIIEYPGDVVEAEQVEAMVDAVHGAVVATGLFAVSHIRVRAIPLLHYRVGGKNDPFIHVQCRIHAGRTDAQKRQLSEAVLAAVREQELPVKVITVEVVEMDRGSYAKWAED